MRKLIDILDQMKNHKVSNYVIAGLNSYLIGGKEFGSVRLFECSRNHQDQITPHTHRFDFACLVLQGQVKNHLWSAANSEEGDLFETSILHYQNDIGKHKRESISLDYYSMETSIYNAGEIYHMTHRQFHSITFSKNAIVLFFEGACRQDYSYIIQPVVDCELIKTYETKDYMFKRQKLA